jgi:hypothetical protein
MSVQLDRFTIALLVLRPDAPVLDHDEAARLQDAHMAISPISTKPATSWRRARSKSRSFRGWCRRVR